MKKYSRGTKRRSTKRRSTKRRSTKSKSTKRRSTKRRQFTQKVIVNIPDLIPTTRLNVTVQPHTIPFYKNMICTYLGIMGEIINSQKEVSEKSKLRMQETFYGKEYKSLPKKYSYKLVEYSNKCILPGCNGNYFIFEKTKEEYVIVFNIGRRNPLDKIEYTKKIHENLINFLQVITTKILHTGRERILLCGHSNGMASAIYASVILLCLSNVKNLAYFKNNNMIDESFINFVANSDNIKQISSLPTFKNIANNIMVCGTGGFPILFKNPTQMNTYLQLLSNRFLHIGLSSFYYGGIIDGFMSPSESEKRSERICNFYFHIYKEGQEIKKKVNGKWEIISRNPPLYHSFVNTCSEDNFYDLHSNEAQVLHSFETYRKTLAPFFCDKSKQIQDDIMLGTKVINKSNNNYSKEI